MAKLYSVLDVDAMFYHSAKNNRDLAIAHKECADKLTHELNSITWLDDYDFWEDKKEGGFTEEQIEYVETLRKTVEDASALLLQSVASTHIFCTIALEAHINRNAKLLLEPIVYELYERLSIKEKWLKLPQLLGKASFVRGHPPFQDFSSLIEKRNSLVHYKKHRIPGFYAYSSDFYKSQQLTVEDAMESVNTMKNMILKLAELLGHESPKWLQSNASEYLRIEVTN